jgi:FdrA protein
VLTSFVWHSFYQDSVVLMRLAALLRERPGVREVAALMGTPANQGLLAQSGLATPETQGAGPEDLLLVVEVTDPAAGEAALEAARAFLTQRREAAAEAAAVQPRTLDAALGQLPGANLAAISVPGAHARFEAMRALQRGLHVFLFSDNVPLADELALKREALRRRLLMMGPDCGTAYLDGVGLGFYNRVPRGRVGIVAASGTGLQAVACHLAAQGEGLSQAIGVGGRDLSAEVGGLMSVAALEALARDPTTEAVVLISKPPHPSVLPALATALGRLDKPAVVCCLGAASPAAAQALWVGTLEDAALATAARLQGRDWHPHAFADTAAVRARLAACRAGGRGEGGRLVGLYTGGTLAHEARLLLEPHLGPVAFNPPLQPGSAAHADGHRIVDLGDDRYTLGRAHPMIDPAGRAQALGSALEEPGVGVVLLDLVLGVGAHPDPAAAVLGALARHRGPRPVVVASVLGTAADPQDLRAQGERLRGAGVEVLPSNAQAARFAALVVAPQAERALLGEA